MLVLVIGLLIGTGLDAQSPGKPPSAEAPVEEAAQGDLSGHSHEKSKLVTTTDSDNERGRRVRQLDALVVCDCPTEQWTRTLLNCPDSCADPQKSEVRRLVDAGQSDDEILAFMREKYGPKVLASPDKDGAGVWTYRAPFIILAAALALALLVLASWKRAGRDEKSRQAELASVESVSDNEIAQIERELEGLE